MTFEKMQPTTYIHFNFTTESKSWKYVTPYRVLALNTSVFYTCFLCINTKSRGSPMYFITINQ